MIIEFQSEMSVFLRPALQVVPWSEAIPQVLAALVRGQMRVERWKEARQLLDLWVEADPRPVPTDVFNSLLKLAHQGKNLPVALHVLEVMGVTGAPANDGTFEVLANAAVRSVEFITSSVSMHTLPTPTMPEVAFIGRSNVGKSSLINMVCNRKGLAFTSKTPGKTQQFNYFAVNAGSKWDPPGEFHLVDLPGVGYAKVSQQQRAEWVTFMRDYLHGREALKIIFHLVDSRHGPVAQDLQLMELVADLPERVQYVVILTKADKRDGQLERATLLVQRALQQAGCAIGAPILATSSVTRLGRDQVWRLLRRVADPEHGAQQEEARLAGLAATSDVGVEA